jgi:hypothetical protein
MAQLSLLGFPGLEPTHNRSLAEVKEWFNQASPLSVLAYCQGRLERLEADKNESFDSEIQEILKVIHDMTQSRRLTLISVLDSAFLKLLLSTLKAEEALQASKSRAVVAVNTLDKLRSIRAGHDDSIAKAKCSLAECKPMGNAESLEVDFGLLRAQVEKTALSISFRQGRALEASFSEKKSCLIIALLEYSRRNKCSTLILNLGKIRGSDSLVVNQANAILSYLHQYPHILHLKIFISEPHLAFLKEFMNTAEVLRTSGRHLNTLEADVPTFTIENFKSLTCSGTLKHLKMMSIQSKKPGTWGSLVPGTSWVYTATSPDAPRKESIASSTAFFATASAYNSEQRENLIA